MSRPSDCVPLPQIKNYRLRLRMGYERIARFAGLSAITVWRIEHGEEYARPKTVRALARVFGITPETLLNAKPPGLPV